MKTESHDDRFLVLVDGGVVIDNNGDPWMFLSFATALRHLETLTRYSRWEIRKIEVKTTRQFELGEE